MTREEFLHANCAGESWGFLNESTKWAKNSCLGQKQSKYCGQRASYNLIPQTSTTTCSTIPTIPHTSAWPEQLKVYNNNNYIHFNNFPSLHTLIISKVFHSCQNTPKQSLQVEKRTFLSDNHEDIVVHLSSLVRCSLIPLFKYNNFTSMQFLYQRHLYCYRFASCTFTLNTRRH